MPLDEFALIHEFFARRGMRRGDVIVGIGDDAAVVSVPARTELVVSTDTLVEGVHFPADTDPEALGHKALAVNLSDLAAMGASPTWATLALTLSEADEGWLEAFSDGLFGLATEHAMELVGGDITRGPLTVTVQALGLVPEGEALRRGGAQPGDGLYVTGTLGDAALGLELVKGARTGEAEAVAYLTGRLSRPRPRVAEGGRLRGLATAVIDVSDGLAADLQHLLRASHVGATLEQARLPLSDAAVAVAGEAAARHAALTGGDDYELLFAMPPGREAGLAAAFESLDCTFTRIGTVEEVPGLRAIDADGEPLVLDESGYRHFP